MFTRASKRTAKGSVVSKSQPLFPQASGSWFHSDIVATLNPSSSDFIFISLAEFLFPEVPFLRLFSL